MQPAGIVFFVGIATQRAHARAVIALERPSQLIANHWITRSFKIDKENGTAERSGEHIWAFSGDICHGAGTARWSEREEKLAVGLKSCEPCGYGMRSAGAGDDGVGWIEWTARSVGMNDGDLRPRLERDAGAISEGLVDFNSDDTTLQTNKLRG